MELTQEQSVVVWLPGEPPSGYNHKNSGRRRFDYVLAMEKFVPKLPVRHEDRYELWVTFYAYREPKRDLDNMLKCVMDALWRGGALHDDWNVRRIHIDTNTTAHKCGVLVEILKI